VNSTFAACAARWCSLSARLLGWRPGEFWSACPPPPSREMIARMMERDADER